MNIGLIRYGPRQYFLLRLHGTLASPLCLTSLVIARAIEVGAIDFDSAYELFHRPTLGYVDGMDIPWKDGFDTDQPIFPLSAEDIGRIWRLGLLIMGGREHKVFYSNRVGGGMRLNGMLLLVAVGPDDR